MKAQFIIDEKGNRTAVILPIKQYEKMLEEVEELEDIRLYDEVKSRKEPTISLKEYLEQRKKRENA